MPNERLQKELRTITEYLRKCTVPLVDESDSEADILGMGALFVVNSQHYLVTAGHVLEDLINTKGLERIGIRLGESSAAVSNLGNSTIETFKTSDIFDAAVIRLAPPEMVTALQSGWRFLSPSDLSPIREGMTNCIVTGYPRATTKKNGWDLSAKLYCVASSLLSDVPEEARDVREGLDIFIRHQESAEDFDGVIGEVPDLKGVSGASIWGMIPGSGGSVESRLRVIGVQTHCRPGSYIRGKSWKLVSRLFKRFDDRAFEEIEEVLNS